MVDQVNFPPPADNPDRGPTAGSGNSFLVHFPNSVSLFLRGDGTWALPPGGGGGSVWGGITGTLSAQTDLQNALNLKANTSSLATVATTGVYNDLTGKPTLGTVSPLNLNGNSNQFLNGVGGWSTPVGAINWGSIGGTLSSQSDLVSALGTKADTAGPTFTGLVNVPTRPVDTNDVTVASTAFVIAQAFNGLPLMNGSASSGAGIKWARSDHVHPTDTSKLTGTYPGGTTTFLRADGSWATPAGSSGDVVGPASSVNLRIAVFSGTTGKLLADGGQVISALAPLASPALTGTPTAPTAAPATNTTQVATTAYADAIAALKANLASPTFTGTPAAPTAAPGTNTTQLATTAFVAALGALKADLASPALTGNPTAPTATVGDADTSIATTAFVEAAKAATVQAVTSSATVTPTFSNDAVKITAQAAALNLANPTGTAKDMWGMVIRIKDNGTARAITYGTQYRAVGVTLPTTTVVSKTVYLAMIFNTEDTKWDVIAVSQEA